MPSRVGPYRPSHSFTNLRPLDADIQERLTGARVRLDNAALRDPAGAQLLAVLERRLLTKASGCRDGGAHSSG